MRYLKRLGVALAAVLVLGMAVASMASAADPLFLFAKTGFTTSGGAGTLSTLGNFFTITCEKNTSTGNTGGTESETFSGTITFTGCSANSLGAAAKTITYKFDGLLCWINEAKLEVGEYILATEDVHLENVPLISLLTFLKGSSDVAAITPIGVKTKTFTGKLETSGTGDQKVTSCGDLGTTLKPSIKVLQNEAGEEKDGAIATSFTLTTEVEGTIDG